MSRTWRVGALAASLVALASSPAVADCTPAAAADLPVIGSGQEHDAWCWAAATRIAVSRFLGKQAPSQCDIAAKVWRRTPGLESVCRATACKACAGRLGPDPHECVHRGNPLPCDFGFACRRTPADREGRGSALSWDRLKRETCPDAGCGGSPVIFEWAWSGDAGGHAVVVSGYVEDDGERLLFVEDPWPPCRGDAWLLPYHAYVGGPEHAYEHEADTWALRPGPCEEKAGIAQCASGESDLGPTPPVVALPAGHANPGAAARAALAMLGQLDGLTPAQRARLGFQAGDDLTSAGLERPIVEARIPESALASFHPAALDRIDSSMYPIVVAGQVRGSIVVDRIGGRWTHVRIGGANWTALVRKALRRETAVTAQPSPDKIPFARPDVLVAFDSRRRYYVPRFNFGKPDDLVRVGTFGDEPSIGPPEPASKVFAEVKSLPPIHVTRGIDVN